MKKTTQTKLVFSFGIVFIVVLLLIALFVPCPTKSQAGVFKIILALAAAGIAAMIPGFFEIKYQKVISASGALGVFAFVFLFNPATLVTSDDCSSTFSVSVFVHGEKGRNDYPPDGGTVIMDMNNNRFSKQIDEQGKATFVDISPDFKNVSLPIYVDVKGFEPKNPDSLYMLDGTSVYIEIKRDESLATLRGTVQDDNGNVLSDVTLRIQNITTSTNNLGYFEFDIPKAQQQEKQILYAMKDGFQTKQLFVYPNSNTEIKLVLAKNN